MLFYLHAHQISFDQIAVRRKEYLIDHVNWIHKDFNKLADTIDKDILKGYALIQREIQKAKDDETRNELKETKHSFKVIENIHRGYGVITEEVFQQVNTDKYEMSFEDIKKIVRQERLLANTIKEVFEQLQGFTKQSVLNAKQAQRVAKKVLWNSVLISILISILIAFSIIKSIARPLKNLVHAAHRVGEGHFDIHLDESSKDEIGEVSRAFNTMAQKLAELNAELEHKNAILAESLKMTQEQKADLEKVNRELDNFVHTVSHDIRAPLVGIIGYGFHLEKRLKDKLDAKEQKCLAGINRGAKRLQQLIEDLLALTRIARIKNPYQKTAMGEVIQTVLDRLEFDIHKFNVQLDVQKSFPEVVCDRIKFTEVFSNLVSNAIKFSSKNTDKQPVVKITCKEQEKYYEFCVSDNGIGIAPENQKDVFAIFKRLHTAEEYTGTGTGLAIVKTIVEEHGGQIWIESELGAGAAFHLTIPKDLKKST